jgi:MFS family permease
LYLSSGQVALQAGFFGFIASMPLALDRSGVPDGEIGLLVGVTSAVLVPAALVGGALVDRFGPVRMLAVGGCAYVLSVIVLLLPDIDAAASLLPFGIARVAQAIGFGVTRPAWLALLPRLIPSRRSGTGLGIALAVQNLSLIVMPPLSLAVLADSASLDANAWLVGALVMAGIVSLLGTRGVVTGPASAQEAVPSVRRYGFTYRRSWTPVLSIMLLYLVHWGAISAYLPQHAEQGGANVGLFFAADGLLSLLIRVPSGWLADRFQSRWLMLGALAATALAMGSLALPVTTATLILAGILTGSGAGLLTTPIYVELAELSAPSERGTAFSMVMVASGAGNVVGSAGLAAFIDPAGFGVAIVASLVTFGLAAAVALADPRLATVGHVRPEAREEPAP